MLHAAGHTVRPSKQLRGPLQIAPAKSIADRGAADALAVHGDAADLHNVEAVPAARIQQIPDRSHTTARETEVVSNNQASRPHTTHQDVIDEFPYVQPLHVLKARAKELIHAQIP